MHSFIAAEKEASICVRKGYRIQPGESVLVLADGNHELEAQALAAAANSVGSDVALMDISSIVAQGLLIPGIPEPPKHVSAAVKNSDVIIIKTEIDYAHRFAHTTTVRACLEHLLFPEWKDYRGYTDQNVGDLCRKSRCGEVAGEAGVVDDQVEKGLAAYRRYYERDQRRMRL